MKAMMKKPAVKKPAMKKFAAGGAVTKKKPVKKYADGGTVEMLSTAGMTPEQMQTIRAQQQLEMQAQQMQKQAAAPKQFGSLSFVPSMTPAQAQSAMMPAGTRAGPSAPRGEGRSLGMLGGMSAPVRRGMQQRAQPRAEMQTAQAGRGRTMMAKGGAVKGKKK